MTPLKIVSVHFPKAAGSSLATQFVRLLPDQVALDYQHDPLSTPREAQAPFPAGKRVVHGHFSAIRYSAEPAAFWLTFLRDPVDTLISIYDFWSAYPEHGNPLHSRFLRERPSVVEFAAYGGIGNLMSETYFGGFDMRRFDFVGFFETRERDIATLGGLVSLPLDAGIHENPTRLSVARTAVQDDPGIRRRLDDLLSDDLAFYGRQLARR